MNDLSVQLDQNSQEKEEEYLRRFEDNKQKALQEKQSKLNAKIDATTLTEEDRKQVNEAIIINLPTISCGKFVIIPFDCCYNHTL